MNNKSIYFLGSSMIISSMILFVAITKSSQKIANSMIQAGHNARSTFHSPSNLKVKLSGSLSDYVAPKFTPKDKLKFESKFKEAFLNKVKSSAKNLRVDCKVTDVSRSDIDDVMYFSYNLLVTFQNGFSSRESYIVPFYSDGFGSLRGDTDLPTSQSETRKIRVSIKI